MKTLYILIGLPGSGKTTFAKTAENMGMKVVSVDDYAKEMKRFNPNVADSAIDEMALSVVNLYLQKDDVIYDACCNTSAYRKKIEECLTTEHKTAVILFPTAPEECISRIHRRNELTDHYYSDESFYARTKELQFPSEEEYSEKNFVFSIDDIVSVAKKISGLAIGNCSIE